MIVYNFVCDLTRYEFQASRSLHKIVLQGESNARRQLYHDACMLIQIVSALDFHNLLLFCRLLGSFFIFILYCKCPEGAF